MPKIVDHKRRREEIATFTLELIRRVGLDNATLRRIAKEGGFSMGVLTHYFRGKDEIVGFAFHFLAEQTFVELDALLATQTPGLARLEALLESIFPKPGRPANFALWIGLWERAIRNPHLEREHRTYYERWRGYIRRSLEEARSRGEVRRDLPIPKTTDLIVVSLEGLWVYSFMDPRRFSAARRRELLRELIGALTLHTAQAPRTSRRSTGLLQLSRQG